MNYFIITRAGLGDDKRAAVASTADIVAAAAAEILAGPFATRPVAELRLTERQVGAAIVPKVA